MKETMALKLERAGMRPGRRVSVLDFLDEYMGEVRRVNVPEGWEACVVPGGVGGVGTFQRCDGRIGGVVGFDSPEYRYSYRFEYPALPCTMVVHSGDVGFHVELGSIGSIDDTLSAAVGHLDESLRELGMAESRMAGDDPLGLLDGFRTDELRERFGNDVAERFGRSFDRVSVKFH